MTDIPATVSPIDPQVYTHASAFVTIYHNALMAEATRVTGTQVTHPPPDTSDWTLELFIEVAGNCAGFCEHMVAQARVAGRHDERRLWTYRGIAAVALVWELCMLVHVGHMTPYGLMMLQRSVQRWVARTEGSVIPSGAE
ncbi:hypothetical protein EDC01DRAFT_626588 [Geopyxis carbonaria]|nr:hypothetical protein EDC01DRAFT_626588 [Geopyxis carbonaria]